MENYNQVAGIMYRNSCTKYGLEIPESTVFRNEWVKVLWDFHIQADRMLVAYQPDIIAIDKE